MAAVVAFILVTMVGKATRGKYIKRTGEEFKPFCALVRKGIATSKARYDKNMAPLDERRTKAEGKRDKAIQDAKDMYEPEIQKAKDKLSTVSQNLGDNKESRLESIAKIKATSYQEADEKEAYVKETYQPRCERYIAMLDKRTKEDLQVAKAGGSKGLGADLPSQWKAAADELKAYAAEAQDLNSASLWPWGSDGWEQWQPRKISEGPVRKIRFGSYPVNCDSFVKKVPESVRESFRSRITR